jgi:RNA polymerase sigma-70 factor (ECF subfamily)
LNQPLNQQLNQPVNEGQPTPASSSEAELIVRAQRGEAEAFEALYNRHKRRIYSLFLHTTRNTADSEDLTQEAFLQVFRKIHTFRGDSAFSTWLHRLSVNLVLMRRRKKKVIELLAESNEDNKASERPPVEFGAPDLVLEGLVDRMTIKFAVANLPPGYKQVFLLHDVLGCEHNEIAAKLDFSIGNSKSQLYKARLRLRKLLRAGLWKNMRRKQAASVAVSRTSSSELSPESDRIHATESNSVAGLESRWSG